MKYWHLFYRLLVLVIASLAVVQPAMSTEDKAEPRLELQTIILPSPKNWFDTTPVQGDGKLYFYLNQYIYNCNECHKDFKTPIRSHLPYGAHKERGFNHGLNPLCLNCHNIANSEAFVNYDGSEIPNDQPVLLCRKCHGPTYRDWEAGIHGRTNGYWDATLGPRKKLTCNQCHNPHRPQFPLLKPMPPPALPRTVHPNKAISHE
jgi:hypothetical protein